MHRFLSFLILPAIVFMVLWPHLAGAADLSLEKDLQNSLARSRTLVGQIDEKVSAGQSIQSELDQLRTLAEDIRATHLLLQERFRVRADRVSELGPQAADRQNAMSEAYRQTLDEYLQLVDSLTSGAVASPGTLERLKTLLDRVLHQKKRPIFGSLPYGNLNFAAKEPLFEPAITPAYKGGDPATSAADLQGSPEAPISAEIAALAESLNWNPVSIYEWVKNNIDTEWYWGCMKGAEETLKQQSGNDCDQAALLVALLRAANFPSRYVRGMIEFFPGIDKAKELTGVEDERELLAFFQKAGIPFSPVISGGRVANVRIEHIWVESYIPYANYRGAVIDELGKTWLGLDTSIKAAGYAYNQPEEIPGEVTLAEIRDNYLTAVQSQTPLEYLRGEIENYLSGNTTYDDLLQTRTLRAEEMKILPASLQFEQIATTNEYTEIPAELMHTARFIAADPDNNELFTITLEAFKLSNRAVSISYEPDTVEDQEIINSYGGLDNTPSYLVRLRPVLKVAGERVAIGRDGLPMGADYTLTVELISPGGTESFTNTHIIGNLSVMGIVSQRAAAPEDIPLEEKDAERLLFEEAVRYVDRWNQAENELGSLLGLNIARPIPTVVTVGGVIEVSYLLDTPHGFQWKGVYVDADLRRVETGARSQESGDRKKTFMQLSALQGSVLESRVLEDDFQVDSISTAELFGLANDWGIPILTIDSVNIDDLLPTLPFADNIKEDLSSSVNQNYLILIPQAEITYEDWTGIGYLKDNPETGEAGYMLSGMIAGGMTAWGGERWPEYIGNKLKNPFTEPPNYDPASARYIQKITATDLQKGTVGMELDDPLQVIVRDNKKKAVVDAKVTFSVKAGGATLKQMDGSEEGTSVTATTDSHGIAEVRLILGKRTGTECIGECPAPDCQNLPEGNPSMWWETDYTYSQQVGENIVDAALESGTTITSPFTAIGFPDEASARIRKVHQELNPKSILSFAGFISVVVEDKYCNPISNRDVTFSAADVQNPGCIGSGENRLKALLVKTDDPCIGNIPTYDQCEGAKDTVEVKTGHKGAAVQVITGAVPGAEYPISAASVGPIQTFTLSTFPLSNCEEGADPYHQLVLKSIHPADEEGNSINAGKVGDELLIKAKMYFLTEGEAKTTVSFSCNGDTKECDQKLIGTNDYYVDTGFKSASVTIGDTVVQQNEGGVFTVPFTLQGGEQEITISGTATKEINKSIINCSTCGIVTEDLTLGGVVKMTVHGVAVELDPIPLMILDENGYTQQDYKIGYEIKPSTYDASTAYVIIYKDNEPLAYLPGETNGKGTVTISRGFHFDQSSLYQAEVVLNINADAPLEMRSKRLPFLWVTVRNDIQDNEKKVEEIKYSNDAKPRKTYHLEISGVPEDYTDENFSGTIRLVNREGTIIKPPETGGFFPSEYPLEFENTDKGWKIKVQIKPGDENNQSITKEKFIFTNLPMSAFEDSQGNAILPDIAKLYGGIGNSFQIVINAGDMQLPIEPLGVILLAIDGLRQDVLYPDQMDGEDFENVNDPSGGYYLDARDLEGLGQILLGDPTQSDTQQYIMLPQVTAIFPSITLASWASIFTGKMPNETGIVGNEFFARDLIEKGISVPARYGKPTGVISFGGGAFKGFDAYSAWDMRFRDDFFVPYQGDWSKSAKPDKTPQNSNDILRAETIYEGVDEIKGVNAYFQGTAGDPTVVAYSHYARGASHWLTWDVELSLSAALTMDKVSWDKFEDYLSGRYTSGLLSRRNDVPFSALTVWYMAGLDHQAHVGGMPTYKNYFSKTIDDYVGKLVDKLTDLDEFDNKIFIIVSDHGMTEMPDFSKTTLPSGEEIEPDTSCELKLDNFDDAKNQAREKENNNLHIWELADILKTVGEAVEQATAIELENRVLAPVEIAELFRDPQTGNPLPNGAADKLVDANIIAAFNGPMAHIYVKGNNWSTAPPPNEVTQLAEFFRVTLQGAKGGHSPLAMFPDAILTKLGYKAERLANSVDAILVKDEGVYKVYSITNSQVNLRDIEGYFSDSNEYTDVKVRIEGLNNKKKDNNNNDINIESRSGDIVLIMKDRVDIPEEKDIVENRYTTGTACKAWHGSLNRSDSYVPLVVSYPGGNIAQIKKILEKDTFCKKDYSECRGNWNLPDIVRSIVLEQHD